MRALEFAEREAVSRLELETRAPVLVTDLPAMRAIPTRRRSLLDAAATVELEFTSFQTRTATPPQTGGSFGGGGASGEWPDQLNAVEREVVAELVENGTEPTVAQSIVEEVKLGISALQALVNFTRIGTLINTRPSFNFAYLSAKSAAGLPMTATEIADLDILISDGRVRV
jgi:hypothetical protein